MSPDRIPQAVRGRAKMSAAAARRHSFRVMLRRGLEPTLERSLENPIVSLTGFPRIRPRAN